MDKLTFRAPLQEEVDYIADNMRNEDRDEVLAATGRYDMRALLVEALSFSSQRWVALSSGKPVALFGVGPANSKVGVPWMLVTHDVFQTPRASRALVAKGRWYIQRMLAEYQHLENYVDARNTRAVRWLEHLGFTVHPAEPYGPYEYPFHRFEMRAKCVRLQ